MACVLLLEDTFDSLLDEDIVFVSKNKEESRD